MVFIVTQQDVDSSSLDSTDIGRWAFIVQGCWQLFDTESEAQSTYNFVFAV